LENGDIGEVMILMIGTIGGKLMVCYVEIMMIVPGLIKECNVKIGKLGEHTVHIGLEAVQSLLGNVLAHQE